MRQQRWRNGLEELGLPSHGEPSGPRSSQGIDAGKKILGRKRSIVTDSLGLLLAMLVTAANVQDSVAGTRLLDRTAAAHPGLRKVWVDGGHRQHLVEHAAALGIGPVQVAGPASGITGHGDQNGSGGEVAGVGIGRQVPSRDDEFRSQDRAHPWEGLDDLG